MRPTHDISIRCLSILSFISSSHLRHSHHHGPHLILSDPRHRHHPVPWWEYRRPFDAPCRRASISSGPGLTCLWSLVSGLGRVCHPQPTLVTNSWRPPAPFSTLPDPPGRPALGGWQLSANNPGTMWQYSANNLGVADSGMMVGTPGIRGHRVPLAWVANEGAVQCQQCRARMSLFLSMLSLASTDLACAIATFALIYTWVSSFYEVMRLLCGS